MLSRIVLLALLLALFLQSSAQNPRLRQRARSLTRTAPSWILQGNIYEVNLRQYTTEGTFKAFSRHLDRLRNMGVQTLWFMPIQPISKVDRKGTLGSYYAVADYCKVNPEFGTMADWKQLVQQIHLRGMKVMIDWVPNHTGADHVWLTSHPDFYVKDSMGKPAIPYNWDDTRQLDFSNKAMTDSMIAAMKFWVTSTGIDGYRVDVAWNVPEAFWKKCIPELTRSRPLMMLAEGDKPYLPQSGFNATYPWEMFHMMEKVAAGQRPAFALDSIRRHYDSIYPKDNIELNFTSNHDENSWNKADYGTFPGPVHAPFAVFTQTAAKTVPLIYSGQEEPVLRAIQFFEKDPVNFGEFRRAKFYKTLLELRRRNSALSAKASFTKVNAGDSTALYAYVRESGNKKVLVLLNLSSSEQNVQITDPKFHGEPYNVFLGSKEKLSASEWKLEPWGYAVYEW